LVLRAARLARSTKPFLAPRRLVGGALRGLTIFQLNERRLPNESFGVG
jgi:hypothetical protein